MSEKTGRNKVHKKNGNWDSALCGSDRANTIPLSREDRDVTCKHCLRMIRKPRKGDGKK